MNQIRVEGDHGGSAADETAEFDADLRDEVLEAKQAKRMSIDDAIAYVHKRYSKTLRRDPEGLEDTRRSLQRLREQLRSEADRLFILKNLEGTRDYGDAANEVHYRPWYLGVQEGDRVWPRLRESMDRTSGTAISNSVHEASEEVVASIADPGVQGIKKKGLVLGHVQSGKTANYAALIAKAMDRGYKIVIVLSGIHNNLRRQTQDRLLNDLQVSGEDDDGSLLPLTTSEEDFRRGTEGRAIFEHNVPSLAVVKKNKTRLENLKAWLKTVSPHVRDRAPMLIIDDEADQATPNTKAEQDEVSVINGLLRDIWDLVGTGTYVGYTATPFANVFMDPDEPGELFPSDFILSLEKSPGYYGAEEVFGRSDPSDAEAPDGGLDMVRIVPDDEADELRPRSKKEDRAEFNPRVPKSLRNAVLWFLVVSAIRRARGQADQHSSMLVHTTHFADPHFVLRDRIQELLDDLRGTVDRGELDDFKATFEAEYHRVESERSSVLETWPEVRRHLVDVLATCDVIVDNSNRDAERVDYSVDENGVARPKTVIVIGGGTLSRGLTLEGLSVSYFIRTTNTYDSLLQMGRWFGYRRGYEDLPRIWTQAHLISDFQFLALVEAEIRGEVQAQVKARTRPADVGLRVRAHPGRLNITARNKLVFAENVQFSFGEKRLQTFILSEADEDVRRNMASTNRFLRLLMDEKRPAESSHESVKALFRDVSSVKVADFLREYGIHRDLRSIDADGLVDWLRNFAPNTPWNVVVVGRPSATAKAGTREVNLGTVDIGLPVAVNCINRAPLNDGNGSRTANLKALMSASDILLDVDAPLEPGVRTPRFDSLMEHRRLHAGNRGLLVIYPISKHSTPMGAALKVGSRRDMNAKDHLIGVGIVTPRSEGSESRSDGDFVSVRLAWELESSSFAEIPEDD